MSLLASDCRTGVKFARVWDSLDKKIQSQACSLARTWSRRGLWLRSLRVLERVGWMAVTTMLVDRRASVSKQALEN